MSDQKGRPMVAGERYGRLVLLRPERIKTYSGWRCLCDCGKETVVYSGKMRAGLYVSCGCFRKENHSKWATKHGHTTNGTPPEYRAWRGIKTRCYNESAKHYKDYGGRGIKMYAPWIDDFSAFFSYIGARPSPKHSIDRIDNNGGYFPGNIRWATSGQQGANKRTNIVFDEAGEPIIAAEVARRYGIKKSTVYYRIAAGWTLEEIKQGNRA